MGEHQAVVGGEGGGQVVPVQRAVQEPDVALLGYNSWRTKKKCRFYIFGVAFVSSFSFECFSIINAN